MCYLHLNEDLFMTLIEKAYQTPDLEERNRDLQAYKKEFQDSLKDNHTIQLLSNQIEYLKYLQVKKVHDEIPISKRLQYYFLKGDFKNAEDMRKKFSIPPKRYYMSMLKILIS